MSKITTKSNIRSDYQVDRNKKIYEEYASTDTSFNKLAKKYDLTPQRIQAIIEDLKKKGLEKGLKTSDPKEKREHYKNRAAELREAGNLDLSISMFDEVLAWDKENTNNRGYVDVAGHKKIALQLKADKSTDDKIKLKLLSEQENLLHSALSLAEGNNNKPEGSIAIQNVHLASLLLRKAALQTKDKSKATLNEALELINKSIENLPGSRAHKAWPKNIKAQIQYKLGKTEFSLTTLQDGQNDLYEGYDEEYQMADQSSMKIRVWSSGLFLTAAYIYSEEGKTILAEINASAVLNMPDPDGVLGNRKREAKEILAKLN